MKVTLFYYQVLEVVLTNKKSFPSLEYSILHKHRSYQRGSSLKDALFYRHINEDS